MDKQSEKNKPRWYHIRKSFLLVLCSIFLILFGVAWWYHLPMGKGPAGPSVPPEPFQTVWHEGEVLYVGMGDSVMTGFGAGGKKYGCFSLIADTPEGDAEDMKGKHISRVFPKLKILNIAWNASSSGMHLRDQLHGLPAQSPEVLGVVVLSTGGIDLIHNYGKTPPQDEAIYGAKYADGVEYGKKFRDRLEKLLDGIKAKFPGGCHIFLPTIYDPTDGVGDIESVHPLLRLVQKLPPWPDGLKLLAIWNNHIREAAEARKTFVHVVDVYSLMLGHGTHCQDKKNPHYHPDDPYYWYYFNLEDPNRRGYDAIRRAFLLEMIRVFYNEKNKK